MFVAPDAGNGLRQSPLRCTLTGPGYSREKIHRRWDTCTSPLGPPVEVQVPLPSLDAPSKRTLDERHRACFQWDGFLVYNDGMTILVSQPGPHRRHRMEPDPMKVAIAETWRRVDGTLGLLEPLLPLRPCSSGMCTEFAVIATAREANAGPAVTPLYGALCSQCAKWESERASLSLSWVGRDPRIYLAYARAGLCICVDTDFQPLRMPVSDAAEVRRRLDVAFSDIFGPPGRLTPTPTPTSPDLRALCFKLPS